jgi:hypothetical protein
MTPRPLAVGSRVRITCVACGRLPLSRLGTTARVVRTLRTGGVAIMARGLRHPIILPAGIAGACLERVR